MQRYKIIIEYDGTNFAGWQRQQNAISIQQVIEEAIYKFSKEQVIVYGAGRTDAGVHAYGQVAHFDLEKHLGKIEIISAINHYVKPHLISILDCKKVENDFHARFSAIERSYIYRIINRKSPLIIDKNRAWHIIKPLNFEAMRDACKYFVGYHDFTSFRASECQGKSPFKTINKIELIKNNEEIKLLIAAPSFLHHMVRNIVGTLVEVGLGKIAPEQIEEIFDAKNRTAAGATAPACGLFFLDVRY